jgi:hypothetical protein
VYSKVLVCIYIFFSFKKNNETYCLISEGRERPEWLGEYESELDDAIASLRGTGGSNS